MSEYRPRVLITGGTSHLGRPLARLLARDRDIRVLVREESRYFRQPLRDMAGIAASPGDIRDPQAVARAAAGCGSVIHLAYAPVTAGPREIIDTAVLGMANVLRACELHGVTDLMLVSSPRAVNRDCYGAGKLVSELMAAAYAEDGVLKRAVTARVYNAYGPDTGTGHVIPQFISRMCELARSCDGVIPFPVAGSGRDERSFIYIGDCVRQLRRLFYEAPPGAGSYDAGSPGPVIAMAELAHAVADCFKRTVKVVPDDPDAAFTSRVPHPPAMLTALPAVDFTEGLAETVSWYRKEVFPCL